MFDVLDLNLTKKEIDAFVGMSSDGVVKVTREF